MLDEQSHILQGLAKNGNTMDSSFSWDELLFLQSVASPAAGLKKLSGIWGIEVKSIVEIGVFMGTTSKVFRLLFPDADLYLIDPWQYYDEYRFEEARPISNRADDYEKAYQSITNHFAQDPKVKIIRKTSTEALVDVPDGVDIVFIDGNHSYPYVKQDIEHWFPKVRPGGIISGHDYREDFPGVTQAVNEFFPQGVLYECCTTWAKCKN